MLVVVDANVVFSALIRKGKPFKVFIANKIFRVFEFVAPEFLFFEIGNKINKLLSKTKLTKEELSEAFLFIKKEIEFISFDAFSDKLTEAKELNFKDSPYLALALKLSCPIFSGDKGLKEQKRVPVLNPSEALLIIYGKRFPNLS